MIHMNRYEINWYIGVSVIIIVFNEEKIGEKMSMKRFSHLKTNGIHSFQK